jgi:hypothetical protein
MSRYPIEYIAAEAVQLPDGRTWRGPNAESNAARALLADGLHPGAWLEQVPPNLTHENCFPDTALI